MSRETCGRCGRDLGEAREGVYYCDACLKDAAHSGGRGVWWTTILLLLLLVGGGVVLAMKAPALQISAQSRLLIGLGLTIIPALLWMAIFYLQDRLEPEPRSYVIAVFVLGILLGGAIEQPLLRDVFEANSWLVQGPHRWSINYLAGLFLLKGMLTAALTYAAVRYTVMPTSEFDERVDGIVYGTAAALGLGVAANLAYLTDQGTISLGVGALQIIITSLAYATFGAIVGFFLGWIKPGGGSSLLAVVGVVLAAVINALYDWIESQLGTRVLGGGYNPWPALAATAVFALLAFGLAFLLISRAYKAMVLPPTEVRS